MNERREQAKRVWDGRRVKALRHYLGMTQQAMAEHLGARQQTISEWETGIYMPRGTSSKLLSFVSERAGFDYETEQPDSLDGVHESV